MGLFLHVGQAQNAEWPYDYYIIHSVETVPWEGGHLNQ